MVGTIERATRFAPPVAQSGPMAAVAVLARVNDSQHEWSIWLEEARLHAVLGSCRSSIKSVKSGIRCFVAFIGVPSLVVLLRPFAFVACADASGLKKGNSYFPLTIDALLAWSRCFRNSGTWRNYLGYVKTACLVVDASVEVWPLVWGARSP